MKRLLMVDYIDSDEFYVSDSLTEEEIGNEIYKRFGEKMGLLRYLDGKIL